MKSQYITIAGLLIDIIGGFLLAVEAIKVKNILYLRDNYVQKIIQYKAGSKILSYPIKLKEHELYANIRIELFLGLIIFLLIDLLLNNIVFIFIFDTLKQLNIFFNIFIVPLFFIIFCAVATFVGDRSIIILAKLALIVSNIMNYIEINTAKGVIGILGFSLLLLGFALQLVAVFMTL